MSICHPTDKGVKVVGDDLFDVPSDQAEIDFENEGGETYICGNPPYKGSQTQTKEQKADLASVFDRHGISSKQIDYVGGWFMKAAEYSMRTRASSAFVSTNSICQGRIVPILWPKIYELGLEISFAHTSFKWANLASHNAGVTVSIVGISNNFDKKKYLYEVNEEGKTIVREAKNITPYLTTGNNLVIDGKRSPVSDLCNMSFGNMPVDGGNLLLSTEEVDSLGLTDEQKNKFIRRVYGSAEFIRGNARFCLWVKDDDLDKANEHEEIRQRIESVRVIRSRSKDSGTKKLADRPHQFREMNDARSHTIILPGVSSEGREFLQAGLLDRKSKVTNLAFALYDADLYNFSLLSSRLHIAWVTTVCGQLETRIRYSNTMGWNTFPVPILTGKNKEDLTRCAEDILLAREVHYPATVAELYDPENMPDDLRRAHDHNDEVLERIYIGRRFKNDTERLEKLFDLYTQMTTASSSDKARKVN